LFYELEGYINLSIFYIYNKKTNKGVLKMTETINYIQPTTQKEIKIKINTEQQRKQTLKEMLSNLNKIITKEYSVGLKFK